MGGQSSTSQQQQSTTAPWEPAQGTLQGILGQVNNLLPNTGLNAGESGALNTIINNSNATSQFNSNGFWAG